MNGWMDGWIGGRETGRQRGRRQAGREEGGRLAYSVLLVHTCTCNYNYLCILITQAIIIKATFDASTVCTESTR